MPVVSACSRPSDPSRRHFLCRLGALGAATLAATAAAGCEIASLEPIPADLGPLDFDVADPKYAGLQLVGGMVAVDTPAHKLLLVRASADEVLAFDRECPHRQFDMTPGKIGTWDKQKQLLTCEVHGSVFDRKGQVVAGPSEQPVPTYPVEFADGKGTVTL